MMDKDQLWDELTEALDEHCSSYCCDNEVEVAKIVGVIMLVVEKHINKRTEEH